MRSLIVVALLAFLAVGFVAARPAEAEDNAVEEVADGDDTVASSADEATQDTDAEASTGDETEGETVNETADEASDAAAEESSDADAEAEEDEEVATTTTTAAPKKQVRPFWPRFGGHGPVVIHRRGLLLRKA